MEDKNTNHKAKIVVLVILCLLIRFAFYWAAYSSVAFYIEKSRISSDHTTLQKNSATVFLAGGKSKPLTILFEVLGEAGSNGYKAVGPITEQIKSKLATLIGEKKVSIQPAGESERRFFTETNPDSSGFGILTDKQKKPIALVADSQASKAANESKKYSSDILTGPELDKFKDTVRNTLPEIEKYLGEGQVLDGSLARGVMADADKIIVRDAATGEVKREIPITDGVRQILDKDNYLVGNINRTDLNTLSPEIRQERLLNQGRTPEKPFNETFSQETNDIFDPSSIFRLDRNDTVRFNDTSPMSSTWKPSEVYTLNLPNGQNIDTVGLLDSFANRVLNIARTDADKLVGDNGGNKIKKLNTMFRGDMEKLRALGYTDDEINQYVKSRLDDYVKANGSDNLSGTMDRILDNDGFTNSLRDYLRQLREDPALFPGQDLPGGNGVADKISDADKAKIQAGIASYLELDNIPNDNFTGRKPTAADKQQENGEDQGWEAPARNGQGHGAPTDTQEQTAQEAAPLATAREVNERISQQLYDRTGEYINELERNLPDEGSREYFRNYVKNNPAPGNIPPDYIDYMLNGSSVDSPELREALRKYESILEGQQEISNRMLLDNMYSSIPRDKAEAGAFTVGSAAGMFGTPLASLALGTAAEMATRELLNHTSDQNLQSHKDNNSPSIWDLNNEKERLLGLETRLQDHNFGYSPPLTEEEVNQLKRDIEETRNKIAESEQKMRNEPFSYAGPEDLPGKDPGSNEVTPPGNIETTTPASQPMITDDPGSWSASGDRMEETEKTRTDQDLQLPSIYAEPSEEPISLSSLSAPEYDNKADRSEGLQPSGSGVRLGPDQVTQEESDQLQNTLYPEYAGTGSRWDGGNNEYPWNWDLNVTDNTRNEGFPNIQVPLAENGNATSNTEALPPIPEETTYSPPNSSSAEEESDTSRAADSLLEQITKYVEERLNPKPDPQGAKPENENDNGISENNNSNDENKDDNSNDSNSGSNNEGNN